MWGKQRGEFSKEPDFGSEGTKQSNFLFSGNRLSRCGVEYEICSHLYTGLSVYKLVCDCGIAFFSHWAPKAEVLFIQKSHKNTGCVKKKKVSIYTYIYFSVFTLIEKKLPFATFISSTGNERKSFILMKLNGKRKQQYVLLKNLKILNAEKALIKNFI